MVAGRGEPVPAGGDIAAVMAGLTRGAQDYRGQSLAAPYRLLEWALAQPAFCRLLLWVDARLVRGDNVALRDLIPALKPELDLVRATEGTIDHYKNMTAEILLMCGAEAPPLFKGHSGCPGAGAAAGDSRRTSGSEPRCCARSGRQTRGHC